MAVVSRVATLMIDDVATHLFVRQWQATATVEQTPEGGSVAIRVVQVLVTGAPEPADTVTLNLYNDAGGLIRAFTLDPGSLDQTVTFHFTNDGTSGGVARHGTVEIAIRATRGGANSYDIETDGSPNSPPAGHHAHALDRGYIRGTTALTESISNIALGGGKNTPASYIAGGGDSLFVRLALGSPSYVARTWTVAVASTTPALSGTTNSTTAATRDVTFTNVVDNRFPLASTAVGVTTTPQNSTLAGIPYTVATTTDDTITVDPRLPVDHLSQKNAKAFATPPLSLDTTNRATTELFFMSARFRNARGEGVNGITAIIKNWDADELVGSEAAPVNSAVAASDTNGGEIGWLENASSQLPLVWDESLPTGPWPTKVVITSPSDAVGLETNATRNMSLSPPASTLNDLTDVDVTGAVVGQVLTFDGVNWVDATPAAPSSTLDALTDVSVAGAASGQVLGFTGSQWEPQERATTTHRAVGLDRPRAPKPKKPRFVIVDGEVEILV